MDGRRQMLMALATGTGKTFLTVAMIYRLLESKVAKRILFLVDRKALAAQAVREFAAFSTPRGNKFNQNTRFIANDSSVRILEMISLSIPRCYPIAYLTAPDESAYVPLRFDHPADDHKSIRQGGRIPAGWQTIRRWTMTRGNSISQFMLSMSSLLIECHRGYTSSESAIWRRTLQHFDAIKVGLTANPRRPYRRLFR
jgi:type I restriction enzyme R subunit